MLVNDGEHVPGMYRKQTSHMFLPIKEGYETREKVESILKNIADKKLRVEIAIPALSKLLEMIKDVIDHKIALTLAVQSINAASKIAPMTDKAMERYLLTGEYT